METKRDYLDLVTDTARRGDLLKKALEKCGVVRSINGERKLFKTNVFELKGSEREVFFLPFAVPADCEYFSVQVTGLGRTKVDPSAPQDLGLGLRSEDVMFVTFLPIYGDEINPSDEFPFSKEAEARFVEANLEGIVKNTFGEKVRVPGSRFVPKNSFFSEPGQSVCVYDNLSNTITERGRNDGSLNFMEGQYRPSGVIPKYIPVIHFVKCDWHVRIDFGKPILNERWTNDTFDRKRSIQAHSHDFKPFTIPKNVINPPPNKRLDSLIAGHLSHFGIGVNSADLKQTKVTEFNRAIKNRDFVTAENIVSPYLQKLGFRFYLIQYKLTGYTDFEVLCKSYKHASKDEKQILKLVSGMVKPLRANALNKNDPSYYSKPALFKAVQEQFEKTKKVVNKYTALGAFNVMLADALACEKSEFVSQLDYMCIAESCSIDVKNPFLRCMYLKEDKAYQESFISDTETLETSIKESVKTMFSDSTQRSQHEKPAPIEPIVL